ncbi:hypothetical protein CAP35_12830 [Chitinophagaceae bacterium IBVUCB1]|jgi:DNA/RNA endonuclease YhcR with UshA esterase domain|nr:hypothetical protein CAP35_12830 [Chitinophagaceae bacterium IBVUCB1]
MNKKRILYLLLAAIFIGGAVGFYMWNKPHAKVEDMKGVTVNAGDLCSAFANNEAAANEQYLNKALVVSGTVAEVATNQDGGVAIIITGNADGNVLCTMREKDAKATAGQQVTVKGVCTGFIITDVTLTDCVLQ